MSTTEAVKELLNEHAFTQALVIDDGFDKEPDFGELSGTLDDGLEAQAAELIESLANTLKEQLGKVLTAEDLEADDWEAGLRNNAFLSLLWTMRAEEALPPELATLVFGDYDTRLGQKQNDLKPLLAFLTGDLSLTVTTAGRERTELPADTKVVFLDLFLGLNDVASAREEAVDRIRMMVEKLPEEDRPVVVLMSTKSGELEKWADDLRERAGLMGAKFRMIGKAEFNREGAVAEVMQELLAPLADANIVGRLIDAWSDTLEKVRGQIRKDLLGLDVADYGYLKRFRLEAEGMPLGAYLLEAYGDVLRYEIEACTELMDVSAEVDGLKFDQSAFPHFLPDKGVNFLNHAMSFVHEKAIERMGLQMHAAATSLQLGDLIVDGADADAMSAKDSDRATMPIHVVISQACDLQQGKSDVVLLLSGTMSPRNWEEAFKPAEDRIDCFIWSGREYSIDWQKANLNAWTRALANRRLKPGGTHQRIGRLRALPAMKAQNLFASNLTRVGTLAAPHAVIGVGLQIEFKDKTGARKTMFETTAKESMACLLKGIIPQGRRTAPADYLVFNEAFAARLAAEINKVAGELQDNVRPDAEEFAASKVALSRLRQPCEVGKLVEHKRLKIEIRKGALANLTQAVAIVAKLPMATATM